MFSQWYWELHEELSRRSWPDHKGIIHYSKLFQNNKQSVLEKSSVFSEFYLPSCRNMYEEWISFYVKESKIISQLMVVHDGLTINTLDFEQYIRLNVDIWTLYLSYSYYWK